MLQRVPKHLASWIDAIAIATAQVSACIFMRDLLIVCDVIMHCEMSRQQGSS